MKLTKEIVDVLKFHGYMTFTENTETFLNAFKTVEQLGEAGFITDRGAIDFLNTIFDENGVNRVAEINETNLNEDSINPEIINSTIQDSPEPEPMKEQEQEQEQEKVKEKKTTTKTTKKTTKKES